MQKPELTGPENVRPWLLFSKCRFYVVYTSRCVVIASLKTVPRLFYQLLTVFAAR